MTIESQLKLARETLMLWKSLMEPFKDEHKLIAKALRDTDEVLNENPEMPTMR